MASARTRTARPRPRPQPVGGTDRRLELLEALLMAAHPGECAQRALAWLQRRAGIRRGVCLVTHVGENPRLTPLASVGVPPTRLRGFSVDLEARDHPLTQALFSTRPVVLASNGHAPSTPLGSTATQAIPLRALEPNAPPAGLLLLTPLLNVKAQQNAEHGPTEPDSIVLEEEETAECLPDILSERLTRKISKCRKYLKR